MKNVPMTQIISGQVSENPLLQEAILRGQKLHFSRSRALPTALVSVVAVFVVAGASEIGRERKVYKRERAARAPRTLLADAALLCLLLRLVFPRCSQLCLLSRY